MDTSLVESSPPAPEPPSQWRLELKAIQRFRRENLDLFEKSDGALFAHLGVVFTLLASLTALSVLSDELWVKIAAGVPLALLYFSLINVTIHHHFTHKNAARGRFAKRFLDVLLMVILPQANKRKPRYVKEHLAHHAAPYEPTDVDHIFGLERYFQMRKNLLTRALYWVELTFIGGHVPGWEEDRYLNETPREQWNMADYRKVMQREQVKAWQLSTLMWGAFCVGAYLVPWFTFAWALPMLLVKNWAHYLGQFQHYKEGIMEPTTSRWRRTKSIVVPAWLNALLSGEVRGHYLHHLYPGLPYYRMNEAHRRLSRDPELARMFVIE